MRKIKTIDYSIEQNKAQYKLDWQTATILALSSGNVGKYEFLTDEEVLLEKRILEKSAIIKRFEYSPLDCEFKKTDWYYKMQYQRLDKVYEFVWNTE